MSKDLFRKNALEHLNAPDQIDQAMRLVDRKGWIALIAIGLCLLFAIIWSWYGRIPVNVGATGLIIRQGGLKGIVSIGEGQVEDIMITPGQMVAKGQAIARVSQPEMLIQLHNARLALNESTRLNNTLKDFLKKRVSIQKKLLDQKKKSLKELLDELDEQHKFLKSYVSKLEKLLDGKIITPIKVEEARVNLASVIERINSTRVELTDISREAFVDMNDAELQIIKSAAEVSEYQRKVAEIVLHLEVNSLVLSPFSGRVVEVSTKPGNMVSAGQPLAYLENPHEKKSAVLFMSAYEGKKVRTGMISRVYPSTVKREEFGGIVGLVTGVSDYSVSAQSLVELLGNKTMAEEFIKECKGAPIVAFIDLVPSADTESGYRWTSSAGPDLKVKTGTLVMAEVTIKKRRPLSLVFPVIKYIFGM